VQSGETKFFEEEIDNETPPDENGIKTITEYKTNEQGQKVKVVKKVRVYKRVKKTNQAVEERRKWKKFGACIDAPPGPEKGVTSLGDEVVLTLRDPIQAALARTKKKRKDVYGKDSGMLSFAQLQRIKRDKLPGFGLEQPPPMMNGRGGGRGEKPGLGSPKSGGSVPGNYWVAPSMKARREETSTIRVTNLSEEIIEQDLQELFKPFGPISRIYLAKDKVTNLSKGFAFINYDSREDAKRAMEALSGRGIDHLILNIEWAKPSTNR